jgi:hypothetical protein
MSVFEFYERDNQGRVEVCFKYHFMAPDKKCIFRMDTHGRPFPLGTPCHLHLGESEEEVENGDERLGEIKLADVNFPLAFHLAHQHIDGRRLPWE